MRISVVFLVVLLTACKSPPQSDSSPIRAAIATSPVNPTSWTVPNWYIDPSNASGNASDNNNCTSASSPCLTWNQVNAGRWGCLGNPVACPRLKQATVITFLSSHTDNSDPVVFAPLIYGGGSVTLQGSLLSSTSTTLSSVTHKNYTAGSNSLLIVGLPISVSVGQLIENTTHPSRSWVYKNTSGTNYAMTQPFVDMPANQATFPAEVDTWTTSDSVSLVNYPKVNLVSIIPMQSDWNATRSNPVTIYHLLGSDPNGAGNDNMEIGQSVLSIESQFQRTTSVEPGPTGADINLNNFNSHQFGYPTFLSSQFMGGLYITGGFAIAGGVAQGFANFLSVTTPATMIDGDFIMGSVGVMSGGGEISIGLIYFDAQVSFGGSVDVRAIDTGKGYGDQIWYGDSTDVLFFGGNARLENHAQSFAQAFTMPSLISTGFRLNNFAGSPACSHSNGSPDVRWCGIVPNVPNLDAVAGDAGFGGNAEFFAGARISTLP